MAQLIGINELLPNHDIFTWAGRVFCSDGSLTQPVCSNLIFFFAGKNEDMFNAVSTKMDFRYLMNTDSNFPAVTS